MSLQQPGQSAPQFSALDQNGQTVNLSDFKGKWLVLYFYPRAMTPGCTTQACGLTSAKDELAALNAVAVGVSPDKPEALKKFEQKEGLNFTLLSDTDHAIAESYGTWQEKSMYGKKYMGVTRSTFIINPVGEVVHVIAKASPKTHHQNVVKYLKEKQ